MRYIISKKDKKISQIPNEYIFTKEDEIQEILANNPKIVLGIPELELEKTEIVASCREFPTSRGNIDILYLTSAGEIIIVETKLIKNPESTRAVVAQVVDYVNSLTSIKVDDFVKMFNQRKLYDSNIDINENMKIQLFQNIKAGYFRVVILGDFINPNILGMVESIQAAPHLAFTIYIVEINALDHGSEISIFPKVVANTFEVERSVIRLEISPLPDKVFVTAELPSKESKGNKPKKNWNEYIETVDPKEFAMKIDVFKNQWEKDFPDSINMGTVGFSAGVILGKRRIPLQFVYNNRLQIITKTDQVKYNIPDQLFKEYQDELKAIPAIYDEYVVGGRTEISFSMLTKNDLEIIFQAAKNLGIKLKNEIL